MKSNSYLCPYKAILSHILACNQIKSYIYEIGCTDRLLMLVINLMEFLSFTLDLYICLTMETKRLLKGAFLRCNLNTLSGNQILISNYWTLMFCGLFPPLMDQDCNNYFDKQALKLQLSNLIARSWLVTTFLYPFPLSFFS